MSYIPSKSLITTIRDMVTYNYMFSGIYGPYYAYPVMMLFKNKALYPSKVTYVV